MDPDVGPGSSAPVARGRRALVWVVALLPVVLAFAPRDLWAPEEPRFGRVAHEMATEGDWLVTRINGRVDAEKPPLLFWAIAGIESVVGRPTPVGARIPGALLALLAVLATRRLARRWFRDDALADDAAILLGTTLLIVWNGPRVGMDAGLAAFAVIALEGATAAIVEGSWAGALRLAAGVGLGMLLKGPHVLYVPLAGAIGGSLAARRRADGDVVPRAPGGGTRVALGTALGLALFAAWLLPALALRGDELIADGPTFRDRLVGQLGDRVAGGDEPHQHGPLYLVPLLLAFGLPWTPFAAQGARLAARPARAPASDRFGLGAALFGVVLPFVLLSIPGSKRETYLVPLMPCVAILAAYALHRTPSARLVRVGVRVVVGGLFVAALALLAAPWIAPRFHRPEPGDVVTSADLARMPLVAVLTAAGLVAATAGVWALRGRAMPLVAVRRGALAIAVIATIFFFGVLPSFDPAKTFSDAAAVARREAPGARLLIAGTSSPNALWGFGVDRYERVDDHVALARALSPDAPRAVALVKSKFWTERAMRAPATAPALDRARVLWQRRVDGYAWYLLTNAER